MAAVATPTAEASASVPQAGSVSPEEREALLRCTCAFVKRLCNQLNLQLLSQCTALVYLHRFVRVQSFTQHDRFVVGTACVFLAAKVEEDMRRLDEVAKAAQSIHDFRSQQQRGNGTANGMSSTSEHETIRTIREKVLLCERVLLHSLSFDVSVTHPHIHAFNILKKLRSLGGQKGLSEFRQTSWNFLNDGLFTDVCVRFKPGEIAAASVLLAYHYLKARDDITNFTKRALDVVGEELAQNKPTIFDTDRRRLEQIMREILHVYEAPRPFTSPGSAKPLLGAADGSQAPKRPRTD
mmetsp:Transcript_9374/g.26588  ORF Transcript_9374/g.26588 Transcript_9374/m.26588 type:complete len:295 (+) Transcript_9374:100-984(+)